MRAWLASYDYNLPLNDAANDPVLDARRRTLAAVGLREGLDGGYYEAQALADAMLKLARARNAGDPQAEARAEVGLDALLAADAQGYQRGLYGLVADLPAADAAADLAWVALLMRQRADMYRTLAAAGIAVPAPGA